MNRPNRILIVTGLLLIGLTMLYGVGYAVFDEHQTLEQMGVSMANGFAQAAAGDMAAARNALDTYGTLSQEYRNEVHAHGHWGMLSLILIVLGLVIQRMAFGARGRQVLAWLLAFSAALFPLGVLLHNGPAAGAGSILSVIGSAGMVTGLLASVYGLLKPSRSP